MKAKVEDSDNIPGEVNYCPVNEYESVSFSAYIVGIVFAFESHTFNEQESFNIQLGRIL